MLHLKTSIPGHTLVKNIIFDFGGVICDLDISRTERKFIEFGPAREQESPGTEDSSLRFDKLVEQYERGLINSRQFRDIIKAHYLTPPSDEMIDDTWNALLVGIPDRRIRLLEELRKNYRIFLLSNSNEIHYEHYVQEFREQTGYNDFDDLFERSYFSYQIHLSKPGKEVFEFVLKESGLEPSETLFIDDTLKHVETARLLGMKGYHLDLAKGEVVTQIFSDNS